MAKTARTLDESLELLRHGQSEKRRSGAKATRKLRNKEAGPALLEALRIEVRDTRTWSTQCELIMALGELDYREALPFLWEFARQPLEHTIIYIALGDAIVRLAREDSHDVTAVFQIMETGNYLLMKGAFQAVAVLRMVPQPDEIQRILEKAADPAAQHEVSEYPNDRKGLRKWIAVAAAGWSGDAVTRFLESCREIPDSSLKLAVEDALKKKYGKWATL